MHLLYLVPAIMLEASWEVVLYHVLCGLTDSIGLLCRVLSSPSDITAANIIHRIVHNRAAYEARNAKKNKSEAAYYKGKQHVSEM